jgi:transposase
MAKDINADPRKIKAAAMLASGLPPAKVAQALGVSLRTVNRWQREPAFADLKSDVTAKVADQTIKATVQNLNQEAKPLFSYQSRKALILKECSHLDTALNAILPNVKEGDLGAIAALIKISERRV